jgi:hypothetical protein
VLREIAAQLAELRDTFGRIGPETARYFSDGEEWIVNYCLGDQVKSGHT